MKFHYTIMVRLNKIKIYIYFSQKKIAEMYIEIWSYKFFAQDQFPKNNRSCLYKRFEKNALKNWTLPYKKYIQHYTRIERIST